MLIRTCYNQRAEKPIYNRLTFAILGVASPGDLIEDKKLTPFNIGYAIDLTGFQLDEAMPLMQGLASKTSNPKAILQLALDWTGGQPFLSQKICHFIRNSEESIPDGQEAAWIEQLVHTKIIEHWESQDEPVHLRYIRDRILHKGEQHTARLLVLYQQILAGKLGGISVGDSTEQRKLQLSGLVVKHQSKLQVYNRIYALVFDHNWANKALAELRSYAEALNAWIESDCKDESRLLRGQALQEAQTWAEGKSLSNKDYQFFTASQKNVLKAQKRANRIRMFVLIVTIGLAGWAFWERHQALKSEQQALKSERQALKSERQAKMAQQKAEKLEEERTLTLFDSRIAYSSLYAQLEDYVAAKQVLNKYRLLDSEIPASRRHARDFLARFNEFMGDVPQQVYEKTGTKLKAIAMNPDRTLLAAVGEKNTVLLFDVESGKLLQYLTINIQSLIDDEVIESNLESLVFHPQGKWLATAIHNRIVFLVLIKDEKLRTVVKKRLELQTLERINALTISPDGTQLASGSIHGSVTLWQISDDEVKKLKKDERKRKEQIFRKRFELDNDFKKLPWIERLETKKQNEKRLKLKQFEETLANKIDEERKKRKVARTFEGHKGKSVV